jgi:hypothetical protein
VFPTVFSQNKTSQLFCAISCYITSQALTFFKLKLSVFILKAYYYQKHEKRPLSSSAAGAAATTTATVRGIQRFFVDVGFFSRFPLFL